MKTTAKAPLLALTLLLALPALASAQAISWFINDGPDTGGFAWSDVAIGPAWEAAAPDAIEPGDLVCRAADLPWAPDIYWACTAPLALSFTHYSFWADLYLSNNFADHSNPVTATLGTGTCGLAQSFVAIAGPITLDLVDFDPELDCGLLYHFDFGVVPDFALSGQSLILKIEYAGAEGDGHIFWDGECCPSALACEPGTPAAETSFGLVKSLY